MTLASLPVPPSMEAAPDVVLPATGFLPDPGRARALDQAVRRRLAGSLRGLFAAIRTEFTLDRPALAALADAVEGHRVTLAVMALYADLVSAIFSDRAEEAQALLAALADPALRREPMEMAAVTLDEAMLSPLLAASYRRHFTEGSDLDLTLAALTPEAFAEARRRLDAGRALLHASAPDLAGEVEALVSDIIFVTPTGGSEVTLHGASSFSVWGGLMLNPEPHGNRVKMVEVLAHESAHGLLHGLTMGDRLVQNPDDERYPSPLRHDPRPMEGIAHACFVLARMHLAMAALLASGVLDPAETEIAVRARDDARRNFADGNAVVQAHARFAPGNAAVYAGAVAYMDAAA